MKLSTRGRYGLRMLVDLSDRQDEIVTLKSVAKRQDISENYLEQVAKDLKRAGYIGSVKGPQGGYFLIKKPNEIIIGDVLRLLEGDLRVTEKKYKDESILEQCVRLNVYEKLNSELAELFDSLNLKDILSGKISL
jgi:Rrf2 family protein